MFLAAVGIWWLLYFNLRAIVAAFRPAASLPAYLHDATLPPPAGFPAPLTAIQPCTAPRTPAAIVVIGVLFLLSAFCCLIGLLLPLPGFLFGFILHGASVKISYVFLAALMAAIGIGLLRRDNRARVAVYALIVLGAINLCLLPAAWYRASFQQYSSELISTFTPAWMRPASPVFYSGAMMAYPAVIGIVFYALIAWVLYRHRGAFTRPSPTAP